MSVSAKGGQIVLEASPLEICRNLPFTVALRVSGLLDEGHIQEALVKPSGQAARPHGIAG